MWKEKALDAGIIDRDLDKKKNNLAINWDNSSGEGEGGYIQEIAKKQNAKHDNQLDIITERQGEICVICFCLF